MTPCRTWREECIRAGDHWGTSARVPPPPRPVSVRSRLGPTSQNQQMDSSGGAPLIQPLRRVVASEENWMHPSGWRAAARLAPPIGLPWREVPQNQKRVQPKDQVPTWVLHLGARKPQSGDAFLPSRDISPGFRIRR